MSNAWPPKGHHFTYQMNVQFKDAPAYTAEISTPGGRNADIATFRWDRHGGANSEDEVFRNELYKAVGAVAVAGGHAEAAMKRVLLVVEGRASFTDVDLNWTELVKRLNRALVSTYERADELHAILDWAEGSGVKKRRDDVIHAYWWNLADLGVQRSRFTRRGDSYILIGTLAGLANDARVIFEFARRLDDLAESDWPQARLPQADN